MKAKTKLFGVIALSVLILALFPATVYSKPSWDSNKAELVTDNMIVTFRDHKPIYMVKINEENETFVYVVNFVQIVEFIDVDADGVYNTTKDTALAIATLTANVEWNAKGETIDLNGTTELRVTFSANVWVMAYGNKGMVGTANVTFVNHVYDSNVTVNGIEIEGNRELKIDVIIENWPWSDSNSKLALQVIFAGMEHDKEMHVYMNKIEYKNMAKHMSAVKLSGNETDYSVEFKYLEEARIYNGANMTDCRVNATEDASHAALWFVYPHFDTRMVHDPSIYVGEPTESESESGASTLMTDPVFIGGILALVAVVAAAVIVVKKRKA